ncbi:hypothetical protein, partial [Wolbachia endosymbiont of Madathamugadia hiepei]|uniref:hypothetical protein n=1 Tax=Wolbachia endosymbiont of Madathamugadia hiepei TaxID=1241303 RepID=UPI001C551D60
NTTLLMIMERMVPVSEHWDDTVCYANYLLIAMFVQLCVKHWDDRRRRWGNEKWGHLDNTKGHRNDRGLNF